MKYYTAMTIAGSDSCGGAGVQADIKTMSALGVYAASAITAITVQNTLGVYAIQDINPEIVKGQIEAALASNGSVGECEEPRVFSIAPMFYRLASVVTEKGYNLLRVSLVGEGERAAFRFRDVAFCVVVVSLCDDVVAVG